MAKASKTQSSRAQGRSAVGGYQSVGKTPEGISVLKPATKPTHFTTGQIRSTIRKILTASAQAAGSK